MMIIDPYRGGLTGPATIEFVDVYDVTYSGAGNETATASGIGFGDLAPGRVVICAIYFWRTPPQSNIASVTIGGIAATVHMVSPATHENVAGQVFNVALCSAFVPTGATGDVVTTFDVAASSKVAVFRATNIESLTPKDTASNTGDGSVSVSIDEAAGGVVVAAGCTAFQFNPFTYTHVPLEYTDTFRLTGGSLETPSAASGQTITMTVPDILVGSPNLGLIAASFR